MKPLIQVAEVWVPDADGYLLELSDGVYGSAVEFGAISRSMCFGRGEGLPGRAWEEGRPIILKDLQGGYFRRAAAAKAAGLVCAVALPIYFKADLKAVVVFFCGGDNWGAGAIELWADSAGDGKALQLADGFYGATAASFEASSRVSSIARGDGLPGKAWAHSGAVLFDALGEHAEFQRAPAATEAGLKHGIAVPAATPQQPSYVLTFLSSAATPIALRSEIWVADADAAVQAPQLSDGYCEMTGKLAADSTSSGSIASDIATQTCASATPIVLKRTSDAPDALGDAAELSSAFGVIGFPILRASGDATQAVLLYL